MLIKKAIVLTTAKSNHVFGFLEPHPKSKSDDPGVDCNISWN